MIQSDISYTLVRDGSGNICRVTDPETHHRPSFSCPSSSHSGGSSENSLPDNRLTISSISFATVICCHLQKSMCFVFDFLSRRVRSEAEHG